MTVFIEDEMAQREDDQMLCSRMDEIEAFADAMDRGEKFYTNEMSPLKRSEYSRDVMDLQNEPGFEDAIEYVRNMQNMNAGTVLAAVYRRALLKQAASYLGYDLKDQEEKKKCAISISAK